MSDAKDKSEGASGSAEGASGLGPRASGEDASRAADLVRVAGPAEPRDRTVVAMIGIAVSIAVGIGAAMLVRARHEQSRAPAKAPAPTGDLEGVPDEAWNDPLAPLFDAIEQRDAVACQKAMESIATITLGPRDQFRGAIMHARCEMIAGNCAIGTVRARLALAGASADVERALAHERETYCRK